MKKILLFKQIIFQDFFFLIKDLVKLIMNLQIKILRTQMMTCTWNTLNLVLK